MNALIVLSALVAAAQAGFVAPGLVNPLQYAAPFYANNYQYAALPAAPVANIAGVYNAAPVAVPAPIAGAVIPDPNPSSQYQSQDEFGNVNYGYANRNSAKQEAGNVYGGVVGSYQYVDANGVLQRTDYIADAAGFRVKASNLPVAPKVNLAAPVFNLEAPVFTGVAPAPVEETAEVKAAKAEFLAKFEEAKSRTKRSVISPYAVNFPYALNYPYGGINALNYNGLLSANVYGAIPYAGPVAGVYNAPAVTASAPATREAVLTKVKLNPGHALFYRVD